MLEHHFHSFKFVFEAICPDLREMTDFLQITDLGDDYPAQVFVHEILPLFSSNEDINGGYIIKQVDSVDIKQGILTISNTELNVGKQICGYMKDISHIALFLCTAGNFFSQLSKTFNQKGDYLEAFIVDAIGSLTVEKAMDQIQEQLRISMLNEGLQTTNRYSPGYCNWDLSTQQTLFKLIGENPTHVSLSESCLMQPIKSVSGIIGIGKDAKKRDYGCKICNNTTCIYRRLNKQNEKS